MKVVILLFAALLPLSVGSDIDCFSNLDGIVGLEELRRYVLQLACGGGTIFFLEAGCCGSKEHLIQTRNHSLVLGMIGNGHRSTPDQDSEN